MFLKNSFFILVLIYPSAVFAYIDPGSGSALTAAILALFSGIYFYIKKYYYIIKNFFLKTFSFPKKKWLQGLVNYPCGNIKFNSIPHNSYTWVFFWFHFKHFWSIPASCSCLVCYSYWFDFKANSKTFVRGGKENN